MVRLRLSSTMVKPFITSVEMFSASMAINTTYSRLIIFWRGETGLFFIAIYLDYCWLAVVIVVSAPVAAALILTFTVIASIMRA